MLAQKPPRASLHTFQKIEGRATNPVRPRHLVFINYGSFRLMPDIRNSKRLSAKPTCDSTICYRPLFRRRSTVSSLIKADAFDTAHLALCQKELFRVYLGDSASPKQQSNQFVPSCFAISANQTALSVTMQLLEDPKSICDLPVSS